MPEVIFTEGFDDDEPTRPGGPGPITREEIAKFFEAVEARQAGLEKQILLAIETMTSRILEEVARLDGRDTERIDGIEERIKSFEDARDNVRRAVRS